MSVFTLHSRFPIKGVRLAQYQAPENIGVNLNEEIIRKILDHEVGQAKALFAKQLEDERKRSYDAGLKAGTEQTQKKMTDQLTQPFKLMHTIAESFKKELETILEREEQNLISLIVDIARKVVDIEIAMQPEIILSVLKNSLELLNERRAIKIYVNPQDWNLVKNNIHNLKLQVELPPEVEIVTLPSVTPGSCKVESAGGSIDADIDTQFEEIRRRLLKNDLEH